MMRKKEQAFLSFVLGIEEAKMKIAVSFLLGHLQPLTAWFHVVPNLEEARDPEEKVLKKAFKRTKEVLQD